MDELTLQDEEKIINQIIKEEYANTDSFEMYVELRMFKNTMTVSFLKKQHAEEFMKYHGYLFADYDFELENKNIKADNIYYKRTSSLIKDSLIDVEILSELNDVLDDICKYIYKKNRVILQEANNYDELSDEWMLTMAKLTPLVDTYHYVNSKKKMIQHRIRNK